MAGTGKGLQLFQVGSEPGKTWNGKFRIRWIPALSVMEELPLLPPGIPAFPVFSYFFPYFFLLFFPISSSFFPPVFFQKKSLLLLQRERQSSSRFFPRVRKIQFLLGISQISTDTPREAETRNPKIPNPEIPGKYSLEKQGSDSPTSESVLEFHVWNPSREFYPCPVGWDPKLGNVPLSNPLSHFFFFFHPSPFPTRNWSFFHLENEGIFLCVKNPAQIK